MTRDVAIDFAADDAQQSLDVERVVEVAVEQHGPAPPWTVQARQRVAGGGDRLLRTVNQIEEDAAVVARARAY